MLILQHDKELRDVQAKADTDFKKYQASESVSSKANHRYDALQKELRNFQDQNVNEKAAFERRIRDLQVENASLKDDAEDSQGRMTDQERQYKHQINDAEAKRAALQETVDKIKHELEGLSQSSEAAQSQLVQKNTEIESLQAQISELQSQGSDSNTVNVLQSQLSDQVNHIRELETTNRQQLNELRKLRDPHRSVQVVEEQKRGLETQLHVLKEVERQLGEVQIQKEILEDEKRRWTSLLGQDGERLELDSPEAVIKALVQTRIEMASAVERLGAIESEMSEKDENIKALDAQNTNLKEQLATASATQPATSEEVDNKAFRRLERQKNLALKEVDYLKAQLKTFDSEETMLMENKNFDTQRAEQVKQLEDLVEQYKTELAALHAEFTKLESMPQVAESATRQTRGMKRRAESQEPEEESSQTGHLLRKNKNLQVALQKTAEQSKMLATELQAAKTQLKSLRESSKTRVFELRDNPTANAEAIKMSTLRTLKEENTQLLAQLRGEDLQGVKVVPVSTVDHLKLDLQDKDSVIADKEKRMRRQREIWTDKAAEFRDVIASVLGWRINFLPNGKAKVSSMFYGNSHGAEIHDDEDDAPFIIFDGEKGTMKISGGAGGSFEGEVQEALNFWVKEKKEIPCFLSALTIQFHDEYRSR